MGADLIVAWADVPPAALDIDAAVADLDDDRLLEVLAAVHGFGTAEEAEDFFDDEPWRQAGRRILTEALMTWDSVRDVVVSTVHGRDVMIGGGTSWGDCPEGFDVVAAIRASGIGQES